MGAGHRHHRLAHRRRRQQRRDHALQGGEHPGGRPARTDRDPGIVDSHTHLWLGALALHGFNLALPELYIEPKDETALISAIKTYAAAHPKDPSCGRVQFGNDVSHTLLDRAVANRPIVIHAPTEHTLWVNGKALAMAGITEKKIADPVIESFVVRDASGRPTGVLRETAMQLMEPVLQLQPREEKLAWLREASTFLNRYGITASRMRPAACRNRPLRHAARPWSAHRQDENGVRHRRRQPSTDAAVPRRA